MQIQKRVVLLLLLGIVAPLNSRSLAQTPRVSRGLQVLYLFDEGRGNVVHDQSGTGAAIDLKVDDSKGVRWSTGHLTLLTASLLRSDGPASKVIDSVRRSHAISVEAWLKPAAAQQHGPARIISVSADPSDRNITLGQQADALDVRLRTSATSTNGLPSVSTSSAALTTQLAHVVYTRDAGATATIFINGQPVMSQKVKGDLSNWDASYRFLVGNEASGDRAWLGELHLVAVYDRALTPDEVKQNFAAGSEDQNRLAELLPPAVDRKVDFVQDVQPILRKHCFECHATGNDEGGLNLAIKARVMEGGQHGPVLARGNSRESPLIHLVSRIDPERAMPPEGEPLSGEQIGVLRAWIDQGAAWPASADVLDPRLELARQHWAFQPLSDVPPPQPDENDAWSQTILDRFVLRGLRSKDLAPAAPADSRRLVRRIYFDLIGLPPTPEEIDQFLAADRTNRRAAVESLTERLLATPHYGERWGRHWLDVARYADSDGQEADRDRPSAYHYRDFVIRAFNDDLPFDTFVRWQIAGDEYQGDNAEAIAATGFLTAGPHTVLEDSFLEEERFRNRYNELDDVISTLGTGLLGLTIGCARCHDHKYDAISSREYYRLLSAFHSGDRKTGKLPNGEDGLFFQDFGPEVRTTWLFRRSDFYDRELQVNLGFPSILTSGRDAEHYWTAARAAAAGSGSTLQRRALADWITDVDHGAGALLARVMVNRVWQHHFGFGLVRAESDFGVRSEEPTHPELLEWLAQDFVAGGWEIKRLHRMIIGSATWQQDTTFDEAKARIDPENRLLWRMRPRRQEAEVLRDSMLAVSGTLNLHAYGPGFKPHIPPEAVLARNLKDGGYPKDAKDDNETRRRSVYMFHKRVVPYPMFQAFDRPDLLQSCGRRMNTTVAPQALALLNDAFVRARGSDFATRLSRQCGDNDEQVVRESFELAISRPPTDMELRASVSFIQSQAKNRKSRGQEHARQDAITDYCQALFALNEFLYID